jgi:catechol 2,3-dioxygenase-like lactoylglutathione lyase family enzyme
VTAPVRGFDHVAVAVRSLERALELFMGVFGGRFIGGGDNSRLGMRVAQIGLEPGVKFELLTPLRDDSWLDGYLARHGEGFHHATFYVDDVLVTEAAIEDAEYFTVDTDLSYPSWEETFTRPSSTYGCLLQFSRPQNPWPKTGVPGITIDDVLAGRILLQENDMWWLETGEPIWPPGGPAWRTFDDVVKP